MSTNLSFRIDEETLLLLDEIVTHLKAGHRESPLSVAFTPNRSDAMRSAIRTAHGMLTRPTPAA